MPGDAALAWMVGDPRARYDVGHWVPVMAGITSAILMGRSAFSAPGHPVRMPISSPGGRDLPALLALDLLGANVELLPPLTPQAAISAMGRDAVDAVFVQGHDVPARVEALRALGARPILALGMIDENGQRTRDPGFPDAPLLDEFAHGAEGPIRAAFSAAAMATQTEFALVMRQLTPAALVAQWRRAGTEAVTAPDVQALARSLGIRILAGTAALAAAGATAADQAALLELRRWLSGRFGWKPT